ncbi:MAG: hydrogenase maturation protease [Deltaproteobacteria bacterium]|nr:hydrogenase maturation protease [Deltaproteobacteria bacterium]
MTVPKITVLGLGNTILTDEGFGVHFINRLSERYRFDDNISLIDGGTQGYALLDIITDCEHLIVIDVIKMDDKPGSVYRFTREEIELHLPEPTSAHEVKFPDVLCKAEMIGELPNLIFLCIVPQDHETMSMEMTAIMQQRFPDMEKLLLKELEHFDITPVLKTDA